MTQHPNNALPAISLNISLKANEAHDHDNDELGLANNTNGNAQAVPSLWGIPLKYISFNERTAEGRHFPVDRFLTHRATIDPQASYRDISQTTPYPTSRLVSARIRRLWKDVFSADCWKLSIPAILYGALNALLDCITGIDHLKHLVIQNNLQYVAASNLDAATFQVSYQMKILTTAGFSVLLLRKRLAPTQWLALLFLAIGVGIVQIQGSTSHSTAMINDMNAMKGFLAVAAACFTSGLAGVYFEMVLKNSQADLWVRNVQLSLFSLLPAIAPILYDHASEGFGAFSTLFRNFGFWAWSTVLVQVLGGLITAMVIKYSDNILKGFATSLSIVISFLASVALFNFQMTFTFVLGSVVVLIATWLYNQQPKPKPNILVTTTDHRLWTFNPSEKELSSPAVFVAPQVPDHSPRGTLSTSRSLSSSSVSLSSMSLHSSPQLEPRILDSKENRTF
ncbi:UDP-galactose transporter [Salix suchowensis]|nr:UDP-galactose transporter [Salix suchowensis]